MGPIIQPPTDICLEFREITLDLVKELWGPQALRAKQIPQCIAWGIKQVGLLVKRKELSKHCFT
jgi:hypothetical protein